MGVAPEKRADVGLQEVFKSVFPIRDFSERAMLEFVGYELEEPKYDVEECQQRGLTFAAPLKVTLRLVVWDVDEETGSKSRSEEHTSEPQSLMRNSYAVLCLKKKHKLNT